MLSNGRPKDRRSSNCGSHIPMWLRLHQFLLFGWKSVWLGSSISLLGATLLSRAVDLLSFEADGAGQWQDVKKLTGKSLDRIKQRQHEIASQGDVPKIGGPKPKHWNVVQVRHHIKLVKCVKMNNWVLCRPRRTSRRPQVARHPHRLGHASALTRLAPWWHSTIVGTVPSYAQCRGRHGVVVGTVPS